MMKRVLKVFCACFFFFNSKDVDNVKIQDVEPSIASEELENLPDDLFTKPLVLAQGLNSSL